VSANQTYNEKELLSRIAEDDEQAYAIIFGQYYPLLYTYVNRIIQSAPETESILQDILGCARLPDFRESSFAFRLFDQ
jgi:DNA-directed RNA polymerase specialized sigma24 family protein